MKPQYIRFPENKTDPDSTTPEREPSEAMIPEEYVIPEKLVDGGAALARTDSGVVFVSGALPGERVNFRVTGTKKGITFADAGTISDPSPDRVSPKCPYFGDCGGCEWQHIAYDAQLRYKSEILVENLARIGGFSEEDLPPVKVVASRPWGYRSRVQLHRDGKTIGFRARKSKRIVDVRRCLVADDQINAFLSRRPVAGIPNRERFVVVSDGERYVTEGETSVAVGDRRFRFHSDSFFQANIPLLTAVIERIRNRMAASEVIVDLYAGSGVFGISLATGTTRLFCVESDRRNGDLIVSNGEGLAGMTVYRGTAERFCATNGAPSRLPWERATVIVDPPRGGLSTSVRKTLATVKPAQLFYLSCDPAALARDLKDLSTGYRIEELRVYDFFPQTSHVETLVEFDRVQ